MLHFIVILHTVIDVIFAAIAAIFWGWIRSFLDWWLNAQERWIFKILVLLWHKSWILHVYSWLNGFFFYFFFQFLDDYGLLAIHKILWLFLFDFRLNIHWKFHLILRLKDISIKLCNWCFIRIHRFFVLSDANIMFFCLLE